MSRLSTWQEIAAHIEAAIQSNDFRSGDRLPTEMEFAREFMVNRHTVRRALLDLQQRQIVHTTQGRGTFVRKPSLHYEVGSQTRFTQNLIRQNKVPTVKTRIESIKKATPIVAEALEIEAGADVIFLERIGYANDEPICISSHYYSYERFPVFLKLYRRRQSITSTLADLGISQYSRARTSVTSRLPSSEESTYLNLPKHVPLLVTHGWDVDCNSHGLGYAEGCFASDRVELEV